MRKIQKVWNSNDDKTARLADPEVFGDETSRFVFSEVLDKPERINNVETILFEGQEETVTAYHRNLTRLVPCELNGFSYSGDIRFDAKGRTFQPAGECTERMTPAGPDFKD